MTNAVVFVERTGSESTVLAQFLHLGSSTNLETEKYGYVLQCDHEALYPASQ